MKKFDDGKNSFFDAVIYIAMFYKSEGKTIDKDKAKERIGNDFHNDLLEIKDEIKLDRTIFGCFDRCFELIKSLTCIISSLSFLNDVTYLGFLYRKVHG